MLACVRACVCACVHVYMWCTYIWMMILAVFKGMYILLSNFRPIFGFANICVNRALKDGVENLRSILIHEISHALVSSQ